MSKSNDKQEKLKKELRCDPKQLALLKKCSGEGDMTAWHDWRSKNHDEVWLQGAKLSRTNLGGANLSRAHLEGANLRDSHMEGVMLFKARLDEANLVFAYLQGARLRFAHLEGADIRGAVVDGSTLFWHCRIDERTDFRSVGLEDCRIDEMTRYRLEYNRRRMNCEDWYKLHPRLAWPVNVFFWIGDY